MKKVYIYALACALTAVSCQDNDWVADNATSQVPEIEIPMGAKRRRTAHQVRP